MGIFRTATNDAPFADGYQSNIVMDGRMYCDKHTGFEGAATGVCFYENGCIRIVLEGGKDGDAKDLVVDEQRLIEVETQKPIESYSPRGGPRSAPQSRLR